MSVVRGSFPLVSLVCPALVERPTAAHLSCEAGSSPLHKVVYDLGTGGCFTNRTLVLNTYETRIVGGYIEVAVEPGFSGAA
ncbi:hypothetical protein [Cryobacterium sp. PH31-O1]|uniref:hypothetical protein n=1 Tax=Cryobacterium sp. PH31-O1 TaxID=3046306 RepID=UPI0024BBE895|nr:hypothetical protein [Cryobacterium sp. PH31-O1]MDJ0337228.1 hypothetical protein [Cryobacterium sp. PH31-O1]